MKKLNLGCGWDVRPGWDNIDLFDGPEEGIIHADITKLTHLYPINSVDHILAQDILEHFSHREVERVLLHWCLLLKPGGTIEIRCPDIKEQCRRLLDKTWNHETFSLMMFGGQHHDGNYHKTGFTLEGLTRTLEGLGMEIITAHTQHGNVTSDPKTSDNPNLVVVAKKP